MKKKISLLTLLSVLLFLFLAPNNLLGADWLNRIDFDRFQQSHNDSEWDDGDDDAFAEDERSSRINEIFELHENIERANAILRKRHNTNWHDQLSNVNRETLYNWYKTNTEDHFNKTLTQHELEVLRAFLNHHREAKRIGESEYQENTRELRTQQTHLQMQLQNNSLPQSQKRSTTENLNRVSAELATHNKKEYVANKLRQLAGLRTISGNDNTLINWWYDNSFAKPGIIKANQIIEKIQLKEQLDNLPAPTGNITIERLRDEYRLDNDEQSALDEERRLANLRTELAQLHVDFSGEQSPPRRYATEQARLLSSIEQILNPDQELQATIARQEALDREREQSTAAQNRPVGRIDQTMFSRIANLFQTTNQQQSQQQNQPQPPPRRRPNAFANREGFAHLLQYFGQRTGQQPPPEPQPEPNQPQPDPNLVALLVRALENDAEYNLEATQGFSDLPATERNRLQHLQYQYRLRAYVDGIIDQEREDGALENLNLDNINGFSYLDPAAQQWYREEIQRLIAEDEEDDWDDDDDDDSLPPAPLTPEELQDVNEFIAQLENGDLTAEEARAGLLDLAHLQHVLDYFDNHRSHALHQEEAEDYVAQLENEDITDQQAIEGINGHRNVLAHYHNIKRARGL